MGPQEPRQKLEGWRFGAPGVAFALLLAVPAVAAVGLWRPFGRGSRPGVDRPTAAAEELSSSAATLPPQPRRDVSSAAVSQAVAAPSTTPPRPEADATEDPGALLTRLGHPGPPSTPEAGAQVVKALVRLNRVGEARGVAEYLLQRFPGDPTAKQTAAYLGLHR